MEELTKLMKSYGERHGIDSGISLELEIDCSGVVYKYPSNKYEAKIFSFDSFEEFMKKIQE